MFMELPFCTTWECRASVLGPFGRCPRSFVGGGAGLLRGGDRLRLITGDRL